jgi:hypothetical protein
MANWGEFLKEFKIKNLKSEGIWVNVDEVLDLYDERQRLRDELALLKQQQPQAASSGADASEIREQCARELEEVAAVASQDPNQPEYIATVLHAAAGLIRGGGTPEAEAVEESAPEAGLAEPAEAIAPAPEPFAQAETEAQAEPVAAETDEAANFLQSVEIPPAAEPVHPAEEHQS